MIKYVQNQEKGPKWVQTTCLGDPEDPSSWQSADGLVDFYKSKNNYFEYHNIFSSSNGSVNTGSPPSPRTAVIGSLLCEQIQHDKFRKGSRQSLVLEIASLAT
jgi:hypothetical protein